MSCNTESRVIVRTEPAPPVEPWLSGTNEAWFEMICVKEFAPSSPMPEPSRGLIVIDAYMAGHMDLEEPD